MDISWPITTKALIEERPVNTRAAEENERSGQDRTKKRVEGTVDELIETLQAMLSEQPHYTVLTEPSEAAMHGAIGYTGDTNRWIRPTRPSQELVQEFGRAVNMSGLEDLWYPSTLITWSTEIIQTYMNRDSDDSIPPHILLSVARFGEAQLCGASEEVMAVAVQDFKAGRYRTNQQWRELMIGNRVVLENFGKEFRSEMVLFAKRAPRGGHYLIHELEIPHHAQKVLQIALEVMDEATAWKMRKVHYQAVMKKVDINYLESDDMLCSICLMEFENEKSGKRETTCFRPLYDVMDDNRQAIELTCGHIFGVTCIEKWLSDNESCPICRAVLIGRNRKLKRISQQMLSTITTYQQGRVLIFYEGIDFDQDLHEEIVEAIQSREVSAFEYLEIQFQCLQDIDLRLGTTKRNKRRHSHIAVPIARWMNEDWDKFATNSLRLREYVKEYIHSNPAWVPDAFTLQMKMVLAKMLNAHRQRSLL